MNLKEETKHKFNFVILCPECNYGSFFATINSLRAHYPQVPCKAVAPEEFSGKEIEDIKSEITVYKGGNTITSLINEGLRNSTDWAVFIFEGAHIHKGIVNRLFSAVKDKKDVVFPIVPEYDRLGKPVKLHMTFPESSINGMTIHADAHKEVGDFTDNPLEISRTFWCLDAHAKGYRFTGVLGTRVS